MSRQVTTSNLIIFLLLVISFGIALILRIHLPHDKVFVGDWIKLTGSDPYHFMRFIDNLSHHFPNYAAFDPYLNFPEGSSVNAELLVYIISAIAWVIGSGSPSQNTVDLVGIYFPAIVGALTIIPVYFIGKELFNRLVGMIAAFLLVILPGEFLGSSILGFTDRNALQALLSCLVMLFFILAVKAGFQKQIEFGDLHHHVILPFIKPLIYNLLAGILLGAFLMLWKGAFIVAAIIIVYLIIQSVMDYLGAKSVGYLAFSGAIIFIISLLLYLTLSRGFVYQVFLCICFLISVGLYVVSLIITHWKLKTYYFPLFLLLAGSIGGVILYFLSPNTIKSFLNLTQVFIVDPEHSTILEMQSILFLDGEFTLKVVWGNFTTAFITGLIGLIVIIYQNIRTNKPDKLLLIIWSLFILFATLALRRFALMLAINFALLTAYVAWLVLRWAGLKDNTQIKQHTNLTHSRLKAKRYQQRQRVSLEDNTLRVFSVFITVVVLFFVVFYPNIIPAQLSARTAPYTPSNAWYESLYWLKDNSPEPFTERDFYYQAYGTHFRYPDTAYGVISWWDYGYLITRVAQRPVICDPGGGDRTRIAKFFVSQDELAASKTMEKLKSRYVIIDRYMPTDIYRAILVYAHQEESKYFETYYEQQGRELVETMMFYPQYYRSMVVRLYNFDAETIFEQEPTVITFKEKKGTDGKIYKEITSKKVFKTFNEAEKYITLQATSNIRLVGTDPFISPIPLESLHDFPLVFSSRDKFKHETMGRISDVKIFEYKR